MRAASVLRRLERQAARQGAGRVLPIMILGYDDGLYRHGGRTYTEDEMRALEADYQLIIVCYGDWPPDDGRQIQMTWGDHDDGDAATA